VVKTQIIIIKKVYNNRIIIIYTYIVRTYEFAESFGIISTAKDSAAASFFVDAGRPADHSWLITPGAAYDSVRR
jgi:hypothetical protein